MPVDFGVSMRDEVLDHKLHDDEGAGMFWTFGRRMPKGVRRGSRMWVANHGRWVGYFIVEDLAVATTDGTDAESYEDPADFGQPHEEPEEVCDAVIFRSASFRKVKGGGSASDSAGRGGPVRPLHFGGSG